jgi:glycosyltransferase involved in cell wall biosynthesis
VISSNSISAVGAVYSGDNPDWLKEALMSLLNQTVLIKEIILVVDGEVSSELNQTIQSFINKLKVIRIKNNKGLANALNKGINRATGKWILRYDADDINEKYRVEKLLKRIESNSEIDILGSWIKEFGHSNRIRKVPESNTDIYRFMNLRSPINHPSVIFKKSVWVKVNGYKTQLFPEDYFFWLDARKHNLKFANLPLVLVHMRTNDNFYRRRSGMMYLKNEVKMLRLAKNQKLLSNKYYFLQIALKSIIRLLPLILIPRIYNLFR